MSKEIKNGWVEMSIENILAPNEKGVILGQGWSPQCEKQPSQSENDWGVLKTTAIQPGYFLEEENKLLPSHLEPRTQHEVKKGDLLITCAGPRNRCGVACLVRKTRKKLLISGKMYRFRINEKKATPEFVELFLLSQEAWKEIDKMKTGGSDSGLNLTHTRFKKLIIPIPPLPEQQAIVAKIEELFSELDKGVESLKTARQQLKVYRQAVLKWAFEGRLTNKNVKDGELPKGWKWVMVKDIALDIQYGYTESSSKEKVGPKFLRITDIQENKVDWNKVPYCKIPEEDLQKKKLQDGDLVFARTGATVGKSFLIKGEIPDAIFASYLIRLRFSKDVSDKYVWNFFQSHSYWQQIVEGQVGIGQPNVNGTKLGQLILPLPTLPEQHKIVSEIETRLSVCDKLEETIAHSLQQSEALRQSILKKAFEGKLVAQNPKDEPASKLLERIRAEREKNETMKKKIPKG